MEEEKVYADAVEKYMQQIEKANDSTDDCICKRFFMSMASSSSQPEEGQFYAVMPKSDCPHVEVVKHTEKLVVDISAPCLDCENVGENWLCLVCSKVYCSRYVNKHMVKHNRATEHAVMLSFSDLSFWCYDCDKYITSPLLKGIRDAAEVAKFDTTSGSVRGESKISSPSSASSQHGTSRDSKKDIVEGACGPDPSVKHKQPSQMHLIDQINGVIYGNCIGDAIGLLTEFMNKEKAKKCYAGKGVSMFGKKNLVKLEYGMKVDDFHRNKWKKGDWTDDSDQMILILQTLLENDGQFNERVFAQKLKYWVSHGYPELGDVRGRGLGMTTSSVLSHTDFLERPHYAARAVWEQSGKYLAPNGGIMRTSILGTMEFSDLEKVISNTKNACMVTHADPRCVASCVAVTVAIALVLQGSHLMNNGQHDVEAIMKTAHEKAQEELIDSEEHKEEFTRHMFAKSLEELELDSPRMIGYTLKCLGAGFWAFRQTDFREAITQLTMEAGDADTNGAVAGALLGCKVGFKNLPKSWVKGLAYRDWLKDHIQKYLALLGLKFSTK